MTTPGSVPLSVLDLSPITQNSTVAHSLNRSRELAQLAERKGYLRYWMAEHHNMPDIASASTTVVLSHIGAHTSTIRIGSGGIMLPNHAPLIVAEQFGTLDALYPGRVDMGLGRAPGTDQLTMRALRRDSMSRGIDFPDQLDELMALMAPADSRQMLRAIPGSGADVPMWLLGSSTFSARLAARKGLPLAFASHFAPDAMSEAVSIYRREFMPSAQLQQPYVLICVNVVAAESASEAELLSTTEQQKFLNLIRGVNVQLPQPVEEMNELWTSHEKAVVASQLRESVWGDKAIVRERLQSLAVRTGADEIMVNSWIYDHEARLKSYELTMDAWRSL